MGSGDGMSGFMLESVIAHRGGALVLEGVSASIPAGVCSAVAGPSGAGKTSLLRLLNRLDEPSRGQAFWDGRLLTSYDVRVLRRTVSLVAQQPTLLTGTIADELRIGERSLTRKQSIELLGRVGLPSGFLARSTAGLSTGEAQRLCLARALAVRPRVLLLDEPTAALDQASTLAIERVIADIVAQGGTVVLVSHRTDQIRRLAGHVLVLNGGRLTETGEPERMDYLRTAL
jgi:putative ABC transport system ATP-binding protein